MKVSIYSLNQYLQPSLITDQAVEALGKTDIELEEVLVGPEWDRNIVVAKVLDVSPHPDADRLKLVKVTDGKKSYDLVCGAPNVEIDLVVALCKVGATLPDGSVIEKAKIRGQQSVGMLCSARELGISDDHSGIMELSPDLLLGASLCDIENFGDVLDIKTHPNRWDTLSLVGLAREISANSPKCLLLEPKIGEYTYQNRELVKVKNTEECSQIITVRLRVKNNDKSPSWLVDNLEANGLRSINPVVDITNFVLLEYGQPSHAYDANLLNGSLQVGRAKKDGSLPCLDGKTRQLTSDDVIIADNNGAVGLAGVIGGSKTETNTNTTEIVLEVANFDKNLVRKSALRHGIRTEASARFERGLPLPLQQLAANRLVDLLRKVCAAEVIGEPNQQLYAWPWITMLGMRLRRAENS